MPGPTTTLHRALPRACMLSMMLIAPTARAQVNVESLRKQLTEQGVHGRLGGSITTYNGNTIGTELGGSALLGYRAGPELVYITTNANYANLGGEVQVANAFLHFRYNHALEDWVALEAFTQGESDRFRRLRLRTLAGVGLRFKIAESEAAALFYGVSYMYEHTSLGASVADKPVRPADVHRMNNYAALLVVLEPGRAALSNTLYCQPRFDDFGDLRLLDILSLDVTVTGVITASMQATLRYESPVPETLKPADLTVKNTLGVTF
jgi:uncharacterized protein DUF481